MKTQLKHSRQTANIKLYKLLERKSNQLQQLMNL